MRVNRSFFILLSALAFVFSSCLTTTSVRFEPGRDAARMAKIPAAAAPATFYEGSVPALFNRGYVQLGSVYYETLYRRGQPNGEKLDESARRAIVSNQKLNRELYADAMAKEAAARGGELLGPVGVDLREDFRVTEGPCLETRETRVYNAATKRYDTRYECVRKSTVHYYDYYLRVSANVYAQPPAGLFTKEEIAGRANEKARNDLIGAYFRFRQAVKSGDPAASDRKSKDRLAAYLENRASAGGDFMGGQFALYAAVILEHAPAVRDLLQADTDLNRPLVLPWRFAETAPLENTAFPPLLATCAHHRSAGIMKLLLDRGADPLAPVKQPGLSDEPLLNHILWERLSAKRPAADFMNLLLDRRADVNAADREGTTPLMTAAYDGDLALLQLFIRRGADLNRAGERSRVNRLTGSRSEQRETALHMAVQSAVAPLEKTRALLEAGCDASLKDKNGRTALDRARSSLAYDEEELKKAVAPALKQWRLESVERDRKIVALLEKFAR